MTRNINVYDSGTFSLHQSTYDYYLSGLENSSESDGPLFAFTAPERFYTLPVDAIIEIAEDEPPDFYITDRCEFCGQKGTLEYGGHKIEDFPQYPDKPLKEVEVEDIPDLTTGYLCGGCLYEVSKVCEKWLDEHPTYSVAAFI